MAILSTDPIADMLTRIRNAIAVNKTEVNLPHSKIKETIARSLVKSGYLESVKVTEQKPQSELNIVINKPGENVKITELQRISKPGRRAYSRAAEIPRVKNGRGIILVSTSRGILTDAQARQEKLGGELICKVY